MATDLPNGSYKVITRHSNFKGDLECNAPALKILLERWGGPRNKFMSQACGPRPSLWDLPPQLATSIW